MKTVLFLLSLLPFISMSAQKELGVKVRWGATIGLNGYNAGTLNLSDDRGRYGFNVGVRSEVSFSEAASHMYMDAEFGLLNLGWKSRSSLG